MANSENHYLSFYGHSKKKKMPNQGNFQKKLKIKKLLIIERIKNEQCVFLFFSKMTW